MKEFIIITGASSGIGLACANQLAALGKNLILVARRSEKLNEIKVDLEKKFSIEVKFFAADVCDESTLRNIFLELTELKISAVINNAGLSRGRDKFQDSNWSDMAEMIETNVKGFTFVAHQATPLLIKNSGHLVNISSIAGREPYAGGHVYCGTKSFVKTFSKALRKDLLGTGVRVTDVAPGAVETEFSVVRFHGDQAAADAVYKSFDPLVANDIAAAVVFALQAPAHVNVEEMVVYPTAQASPTEIFKS